MKFLFQVVFIGVLLVYGCADQPRVSEVSETNVPVRDTVPKSIMELLGGSWIHEEDSLAVIKVSGNEWTFMYSGEATSDDIYKISITDKLPEFVKETEKADFIILTTKTDTMYFELLGLSDSLMSLLNFPTGRIHVYNKSK